tara:strand:- start:1231 stop:3111 length:1881 start_codon:yes stop_codon:yes gene_type:complete
MVTAVRKILNTGTNKFENAVNQMTELIYSSNQYVSLNSNTFTEIPQNDLQSLNEFWLSACYFQRITRDNYRLCFPRRDWEKSTVYDRYDSEQTSETQNCFVFDPFIGDGVLFLCVGNNESNKTNTATASVYRPSGGYSNVRDLPTAVIETDDGYSWIALAQSDNRFTDSNWISLEVRDRLSFFGGDEGTFINDGVSLDAFKNAISSPFSAGSTGPVRFYGVDNLYNQTSAIEATAGLPLFDIDNMQRFDVFQFQQSLRNSGINTQIRFGQVGATTGSLPSTINGIGIDEQINNSPFSDSTPVGWYNKKVQGWAEKAGSVEMVYLDTSKLSASDLTVSGATAPTITVLSDGTAPSVEFDLTKIKEDMWFIKGVKISKDLSSSERLVGKDNTKIDFVVSNTGNNYGFSNALKGFITPYDGLLIEQNLYGPIVPVNSFMASVTMKESDISTTLRSGAFAGSTPTSFDSYALISEPTSHSHNRELGLDLPPNTKDTKSNLVYALLTFASGKRPAVGDKIFKSTPTLVASTKPEETTKVRGDVIGVVQATNLLSATQADILFSTTNRSAFTTGADVFIEDGTSFFESEVTAKGDPDIKALSGTITHIGNSNFDLSGNTAEKRLSVKYITRV